MRPETRPFISLDLGTANVLAYVSGQGVVYNEPSLMAYNNKTNSLIALGKAAYDMVGKTHGDIRMVTPLVDGVIADMEAAQDLLKHIFSRMKMMNIWKNAIVLLACPSGVTELEREALKNVAKEMGAELVIIEEEAKMAALGAGINIELPQGHLIIDIGGGTTDLAIISSGDIVVSRSIKVAGSHFDDDIRKYIRSEYNIAIGQKTAEDVKKFIGSLVKYHNERSMQIYGRDIVSGLPKEAKISSEEIRNVLLNAFSKITDLVIELLENTPPELAGDIMRNGITVCGGGALIRNIDKYFFDIFQLPTKTASDPLNCVIEGTKIFEKTIKKNIENGLYNFQEKGLLSSLGKKRK
ncbi:MAG: rod shape-determining protein [Spiroplasma poulsonii]|uniref:Cell shape-determining protein MreB n=1 Tax=Spiroplasma poulsonii TaxID=2138 RepID=A0A2P6FGS7_9MOLU|nr:rod shape-determining protein [Spiroplasma poulsonii]KAF0849818.1 Rod shape-determining protein MreB [Spiroplasma poulsonii]MBW1242128.1 rod shape-determining protein [Spiroplasma poulsonii]PQM32524.1 Rod shape-determining protein MreB [Spiroplasma poulsonii]PWF97990.1 Rod shape-determining protein MreB [Spiroplasma poulsonii]